MSSIFQSSILNEPTILDDEDERRDDSLLVQDPVELPTGEELDAIIRERAGKMDDLDKFQVKESLSEARQSTVNPDAHGIDVNRADNSGVPVTVAQDNRNLFDGVDLERELDRLNPAAARWLTDRDNAILAKDDKSSLQSVMDVWNARNAYLNQGRAELKVANYGWKNLLGTLTDEDSLGLLKWTAEMERLQKANMLSPYGSETAGEAIMKPSGFVLESFKAWPMLVQTQLGALDDTAIGAAMGLFIPAPGAVIAGAAVGWRAGVGLEAGMIEAGLAFQEYIKVKDDNGHLLDRDTARAAALITGAANGAMEVVFAKQLAKMVPGGEAFLQRFTRDAIKEVLRSPTGRRVFTDYVKRVAKGGSAELVVEFMQETVTTIAGAIAKAYQQGNLGDLTSGDFWYHVLGTSLHAGVKGFQGGTGITTVAGVPKVAIDAQRSLAASRNQKFITDMGNLAKESKTNQRAPGRFGDFIRGQAQGTDAENVYIDGRRFFQMFQSQGIDVDDVIDEFNLDPEEVDAVLESGGDIKIDIGDFASKIAPVEQLYKMIEADIKFNPDAMTPRENITKESEMNEDAVRTAERLQKEYDDLEDAEIVRREIQSQLRNAGMGTDVAEFQTQQAVAFFETMAATDGTTVLEAYGKYGVRFERALERSRLGVRDVSAAQSMLAERARTGRRRTERQLFGPSLIDYVRERGIRYDPEAAAGQMDIEGGVTEGVDPMIGDLLGMDVDVDLRPGQRRAMRPEGMTLDDLALAAQEEGYFPERDLEAGDRIDINDLLEAIRENLAGTFRYVPEVENVEARMLDEAADQLVAALNSIGLDPQEMTVEEIIGVIEEQSRLELAEGEVELRHGAWHGTGAEEIEGGRLDIDRVGVSDFGTRGTAFGWGLYFATERGIANHYREIMSGEVLIKGVKSSEYFETPEFNLVGREIILDVEQYDMDFGESLAEAIRRLGRRQQAGMNRALLVEGYADAHRRDMEKLVSLTEGDITKSEGSLLTVELAPDIDDYLDWDAPFQDQPLHVQEALLKLFHPSEGVYFNFWDSFVSGDDTLGTYVDISREAKGSEGAWERTKAFFRGADGGTRQQREVTAARKVYQERKALFDDHMDRLVGKDGRRGASGQAIYEALENALGSQKQASVVLRNAGIPGNKFLDANHRSFPREEQMFGSGRDLMFRGEPITNIPYEGNAELMRTDLTGAIEDYPINTFLNEALLEAMAEQGADNITPDVLLSARDKIKVPPTDRLLGDDEYRHIGHRAAIAMVDQMLAEPDQVSIEKTGRRYNYVIYDDTLVEITGKQGIDFFQSSVPLQSRPLKIEGTGPHGRITNWDFGEAITDRHMAKHGRVLDPTNDPEDFKTIVRETNREFRNQAREEDTGEAWYTEDIAEAMEVTSGYIPELHPSRNRAESYEELFLVMAALMSPQERPPANWEKASLAFEGYVPEGVIPETKPNGKGWGVNAKAFPLLQHMLNTMGLDETLDWLSEPHTGREIAEMRRSSGIFHGGDKSRPLADYGASEVKLKADYLGIYMFGPKVGDFMMNATGLDLEAVTVDIWLARTYNRHIGRLLDVFPSQRDARKIIGDIRGPTERATIKRWVRELAERNGISASAMQAALWYYEQRLYRNHGIPAESTNFSGAAVLASEGRGIPVTRRGEDVPGVTGAQERAEAPTRRGEEPPELFQRAAKGGLGGLVESPFYSAVKRASDALTLKKGTGEQFLSAFKKTPGVREEEISWIGLDDFLAGKSGLARQEVQEYIDGMRLQVETIVKYPEDNVRRISWQNREIVEDPEYVSSMAEEFISELDLEDRYGFTRSRRQMGEYLSEAFSVMSERNPGRYPPLGSGPGRQRVWVGSDDDTPAGIYEGIIEAIREGGVESLDGITQTDLEDAAHAVALRNYEANPVYQTWDTEGDYRIYGNDDLGWAVEGVEDEVMSGYDSWIDASVAVQAFHEEDFIAQGARHETWTLPNGINYREVLIKMPPPGRGEDPYPFPSHAFSEPDILAWVRLNERFVQDDDGNALRVLFIEEIQSDWHQRGEKRGYIGQEPPPITPETQAKMDRYEGLRKTLAAHDHAVRLEQSDELRQIALDYIDALPGYGVTQSGGLGLIAQIDEIHADDRATRRYGNATTRQIFDLAEDEGWRYDRHHLDSGFDPETTDTLQSRRLPEDVYTESLLKFKDLVKDLEPWYFDNHADPMIWKWAERPVKDAPFKKTWHEMAFRQIMHMAAVEGFDKLGWTTGEIQADRYEKRTEISSIYYRPNDDGTFSVTAHEHVRVFDAMSMEPTTPDGIALRKPAMTLKDITEAFGEGIAKKVEARVGKVTSTEYLLDRGKHWPKNVEMKVGGKFFKTQYNKKIRNYASKFGKKFDSKVELELINTPEDAIPRDIEVPEQHDIWTMPVSDKMRETVVEEGVPLFQPRRGKGPRGSFRPAADFGEGGESIITLFESADSTTVLHELSHFFLETMRDRARLPMATEQMKRDWATLEDWWARNPELIAEKATKEAAMRGLELEITAERASAYSKDGTTGDAQLDTIMFVAQHEFTADAHEAYLMEGKAPSLKLAEAFERFSAWFIRVYGAITNLGVMPPDEVKKVFDRWLATEAEIKEAEDFSNAAPMFESLDEFAGTQEEYDEYRAAEVRGHAQAKQELLRRKILDLKRQETAEGQALKDEVYARVENEINQMPVYRVWEWLARGRVLAGDQPELLEPGKRLSKNWLVQNFGDEIISILPKGGNRIHQRDTEGNQGLNPDLVAEAFGFKSVDEMIDAIIGAPNRKKFIEQEQKARLEDDPRWQGDTVQSGNIEQAAIEEFHSDERGTFLHLELQAINRKGGLDQPSPRQVAKETARRIISRLKVGTAITPGKYRSSEVRYAKEAQQAVAEGNFQAASTAKYHQLLNHYLFSESLAARQEMDKAIGYVKKFSGPGKRLRNINYDYVERIQGILAAYQFGPRLSEKRRERLNTAALEKWAEQKNEDEGAEILIPQEILDADELTHFRDIPVSEFRALIDTIKNLEAQGRLITQIIIAHEKLELNTFAAEVNESVIDNWHGGFRNIDEPPAETETKKGKLKRVLGLRKMEFVLRRLDGFKYGPMSKIFQMIADADDNFAERRHEAAGKFREIWGVYTARELRRMSNKKIFIPALNMSLTKDAILAVALNVGNEDNRAKMMEGYGWNDTQVDAILRLLDDRDWKVVQDVFDHLQSYWAETVKLDTERRGFPASKVEGTPIILDGVEKASGGYYPLKWDYLADGRARDDKVDAYDLLKTGNQSMSAHPSTHVGRTIERKASAAGRKVKLQGMNIYLKAVDETIHDLSWRATVKDVTKILNHKDVREALQQTIGRDGIQQFSDWFSDSVVGDQSDPRTADEIFRVLRGRISVATMGWKVSTALVQPLGYFSTVSRLVQDYGALGGFYAMKGIKDFYGNPAKIAEKVKFVHEKSAFMRQRSRTFDRDIYDNLKRLRKGHYGQVEASFFWMVSKLQLSVDLPTWFAVYEAVQAQDPSMTEEQAVNEADSVVRMTQSSGAAKDLTNFQRGGEGKKLFSFYMTFFSAMTNMMEDQFIMARENKKYIPRAIASLLILTFMPVVAEEAVRAALGVGGPDEEDEEGWFEFLMKKWAGFSVGGIPIVRDVVNTVVTDFDYSISPVAKLPEQMIRAGTQIKEVFWNEDDGLTFDTNELDKKLAKSLVDTVAIAVPLPASQIKLTGEYFYDYFDGEKEPDSWVNFLAEAFYRKDPKDYRR